MTTKREAIDRLILLGNLGEIGEINYPTVEIEPSPQAVAQTYALDKEGYVPDSEIRAIYAINHSEDYTIRDTDDLKVRAEKIAHFNAFAKQRCVELYMRTHNVEKAVAVAAIEEIEKQFHEAVMTRLAQTKDLS